MLSNGSCERGVVVEFVPTKCVVLAVASPRDGVWSKSSLDMLSWSAISHDGLSRLVPMLLEVAR